MGDAAARVPTRVLPHWLVRARRTRQPVLAPMVSELGKSGRDE